MCAMFAQQRRGKCLGAEAGVVDAQALDLLPLHLHLPTRNVLRLLGRAY